MSFGEKEKFDDEKWSKPHDLFMASEIKLSNSIKFMQNPD